METVTIKVTLEREIELPRDTWEELFDEQLPSKQETLEGKEYCLEHSKTNCVICGEQATHECAETFQFVCGTPLCDKEICKIKHHPNHFKFTPRQWGGDLQN